MLIKSHVDTGTFERVQKIVTTQFDLCPGLATADARFHEDLGADALDWVELVMTIAREFGSDVLDEDFQGVQTVGELAAYLTQKQTGVTDLVHA